MFLLQNLVERVARAERRSSGKGGRLRAGLLADVHRGSPLLLWGEVPAASRHGFPLLGEFDLGEYGMGLEYEGLVELGKEMVGFKTFAHHIVNRGAKSCGQVTTFLLNFV